MCSVNGCRSYIEKYKKDHLVQFHSFPKDKTLCDKWVRFCGPKSKPININVARICSKHFLENQYVVKNDFLSSYGFRPHKHLQTGSYPLTNFAKEKNV